MYLRRDGVAEMHAANTLAQNEIGKVSCIANILRRRSSLSAVSKWIILFNLIARGGIIIHRHCSLILLFRLLG